MASRLEPSAPRDARIGIDYAPASRHATGVGRYVRELVRALALREQRPALSLFDVGPPGETSARPLAGSDGLEPLPGGWRRLQADLPASGLIAFARAGLSAARLVGGCELFHGARAQALEWAHGPARTRRVLALSEWPSASGPQEARLRALASRLDALVVFSAAARERFAERLNLDPERVVALPVGCDHWLRTEAPRDAPWTTARLVSLARTDRTRGALQLIAAVRTLRARGVDATVTLLGRAGDAEAEVLRAGAALGPRFERIPSPGERAVAQAVARSAVLVHLAREDWTPVTLLEGAAFGAALVASDLPAWRESLGPAAEWVASDPADDGPFAVQALADAVARALPSGNDPRQRSARRTLAAPFTWDRHASLTHALWQRILSQRPLSASPPHST